MSTITTLLVLLLFFSFSEAIGNCIKQDLVAIVIGFDSNGTIICDKDQYVSNVVDLSYTIWNFMTDSNVTTTGFILYFCENPLYSICKKPLQYYIYGVYENGTAITGTYKNIFDTNQFYETACFLSQNPNISHFIVNPIKEYDENDKDLFLTSS